MRDPLAAFRFDPTPAEQIAAGCADGHDPASATGVCTRCGYDVFGYWTDDHA